MNEFVYHPDDSGPKRFARVKLFKGGSQSSTTVPTVPSQLQPLLSLYTSQATNIANTPYQYYSGQRYADLNPTQNNAIQMIQDRASNGSPVMDQANATLTSTLKGGNTNPYLDSLVQRAQDSVKSNMIGTMVGSGSFGNSGVQEAMGRALGDTATSMYGNAYNTDRANQMQALGMAPQYGNQAYTDAGQLLNAGNVQQQNTQNNLDFGYQQFQDAQNYPFKQLQATGGVLGQNMGQTTVQKGGGK